MKKDKSSGSLHSNVIVPPGPERDRSGPERDRYKERLRGRMGKPSDIIDKIPIGDGKPGIIKYPVGGAGSEPTWRPGRDGQGGPGSPGPGESDPGSDPGDYVEVTWEEFVKMLFDELELPNMLKKMMATTFIKTQKVRGIARHGPKARLNKRATARARIRRGASLRNAQPERFVAEFADKCQAVFEAYVTWAALTDKETPLAPRENFLHLIGGSVEKFLIAIETVDPFPHLIGEAAQTFRAEVVATVVSYLESHAGETVAPYTCHESLRRRIEVYVYDIERQGRLIPTVEEVPFHDSDMRYNRLVDKFEPDSKCAAFLVLDRSGSMDGDPLSLCKMYFFLCVLFLRTRYKTVEIIYISHDAEAWLWKNEKEFFNIGSGGGTMAGPAWDLVCKIAESGAMTPNTGNSAGPFPRNVYNRYMFHGTDGDLFDGEDQIRAWWTKIIMDLDFNYCGYLEVGTSWTGFGRNWRDGGYALRRLPPEVKERVGMAKANRKEDVVEAFKEILIHNANEGGG